MRKLPNNRSFVVPPRFLAPLAILALICVNASSERARHGLQVRSIAILNRVFDDSSSYSNGKEPLTHASEVHAYKALQNSGTDSANQDYSFIAKGTATETRSPEQPPRSISVLNRLSDNSGSHSNIKGDLIPASEVHALDALQNSGNDSANQHYSFTPAEMVSETRIPKQPPRPQSITPEKKPTMALSPTRAKSKERKRSLSGANPVMRHVKLNTKSTNPSGLSSKKNAPASTKANPHVETIAAGPPPNRPERLRVTDYHRVTNYFRR
jgi:hypothetical protein